jgi:hypothetical protein
MRPGWLLLILLIEGCTKPNPRACHESKCSDPAFPFCDSDGFVAGVPGACIAVTCAPGTFLCDGDTALQCAEGGDSYEPSTCPKGCDPNVGCKMACAPGAGLVCTTDHLVTCAADGISTETQTCALGCAPGEARCQVFEPLNGLGPALEASASEPDVVLPAGSRVDTDQGLVEDQNGTAIGVATVTIQQISGPNILVLKARSFHIDDTTVTGTAAVAFVAAGDVEIVGRVSARGLGLTSGPGADTYSGTCLGGSVKQYLCGGGLQGMEGAGGAGNGQPGGWGGGVTDATGVDANGGAALQEFSPLRGGCRGGKQTNMAGSVIIAGGGGAGGSVEIASRSLIRLSDRGLIDVGAGGGEPTAGGGSGGTVILEAPTVSIAGATAGVVANGGAGGGCNTKGADATADLIPAPGATCPYFFSGHGGTVSARPGNGCTIGSDDCTSGVCPAFGGGGGAVGRLRIATKDGVYGTSASPVLSAIVTTATLTPR